MRKDAGSHFHRPECVWIEDIPLEKLTGFYPHEQAVEADYKPVRPVDRKVIYAAFCSVFTSSACTRRRCE